MRIAILGFILGVTACWLFGRIDATNNKLTRPFDDKKAAARKTSELTGAWTPRFTLVEPGELLPKDKWILDYEVYFTLLEGLESHREYALVTLKPRSLQPLAPSPHPSAGLWITGLSNNTRSAYFFINPSKADTSAATLDYDLLDLRGDFFGRRCYEITGPLKVESNPRPAVQ